MSLADLHRLARLHSILPEYQDGFRQRRRPSEEALRAVLREFGARCDSSAGLRDEIRSVHQRRWSRLVEPVVVCWEDRRPECAVRLTPSEVGSGVDLTVRSESGDSREWRLESDELITRREVRVEGTRYWTCVVPLDGIEGHGYYRLCVRTARRFAEALVIRAPRRAPDLTRTWGAFVPLYALHSSRSPCAGTFAELGLLTSWVQSLGGGLVATLPLLATYLDEPYEPSPYTPVSRCFWNEFYLDLSGVPEWRPEFGGVGAVPVGRHLDYRALMRDKRRALERSAESLGGVRRDALTAHVDGHPELRAYAAYRAGMERGERGARAFDLGERACLYHCYVQWLCESQIAALAGQASARGPGLYLDLPLGVHPLGFDMHRHAQIFAASASGGSPPDRFFSKGQNWGFAPLHPARARERGHRYFIACLRHHMRHAGVLRIDHVMGLHRMYWIPRGFDGDQGAYVGYPTDELYAITCLEARRNGVAVVGEDLGTVPGTVRQRMAGHGFRRSYVAQFEFHGDRDKPRKFPPKASVATINTHDTPLFAAFWSGQDIESQVDLGLLDREHAVQARKRRRELCEALLARLEGSGALEPGERSARAVLQACLDELAASDAECVIVTLEDLWGERSPQNTPGTDRERPNWTRRAERSLERLCDDADVRDALLRVGRYRRRPRE